MIEIPLDIISRLGLALLAGIIIGLNRWMHHKSAGIRTHSMVALGASVAMLLISQHSYTDAQAQSRVLQGIVTGIGFLGAGVIIRENSSKRVHGLTTAASIWTCALLGAAFGAGAFSLAITALAMMMLTLLIGGPLETILSRFVKNRPTNGEHDTENSAHSKYEG
ncbi:MgtC/SapB family protein [Orrella sp. NBD-18]|uniref:Protein MgtC n=1 Tax=Sheuella amnicola TaxID=2707330 RepID=A0A6B2R293_9BURK|nr:MgtC/SapB family protein [Sheuella amnicola]NDY83754.1 MgtC/SapB family protein [Sheuella amnicola]